MLITNQTNQGYWFGPLHLAAGVGQTLTVDDTSATSLYLTDDGVADAINTLYASNMIQVTGAALPFPRPTGTPQMLHGDGSPEGIVYAGQGSVYLRRDNSGGAQFYQKTTGIHVNTGWVAFAGAAILTPTGAIHAYGGATAPSGWLICDGSAVSRTTYADLFGVIQTTFGAGDGSSTFNVPDCRGRVPVAFAASGGHTDVSALGNNEGSSLANRRPKHPHTNALTLPNHSHAHSLTLPNHAHSQSLTLPDHVHIPYGSFDSIGVIDSGGTDVQAYSSGSGYTTHTPPTTGNPSAHPSISGTVGNPTSNPSISGTVDNPTSNPSINGTVGAAGTANDAPAYIVLNYIIKT